jgi:hypothetical protein
MAAVMAAVMAAAGVISALALVLSDKPKKSRNLPCPSDHQAAPS